MNRIVVLAGGYGGARFLLGLRAVAHPVAGAEQRDLGDGRPSI